MSSGWMRPAAIGIAISVATACASRPDGAGGLPRPRATSNAVTPTSRDGLEATITARRARLARDARDTGAAVALADALLRQTRVSNNAGLAAEAERVLVASLSDQPEHYDARRMLAAVYLSQHRFRDALNEATRCLTVRTNDAVIYGIVGDAHIELGDYPEAFDAFDRMNAMKPTAASYGRTSYARELQGDLAGALRLMQMAAEATTPEDTESLAWHHAQLGHLYLELGRIGAAEREYLYANHVFPGHPFAADGLARVATAQGDYARALDLVSARLGDAPMPADFALAGDLMVALGRTDEAERHYRLAEAAWRSDVPEPARLARFMAERGRHVSDAVRLAEATIADRRDIFTADALAWAYFRAGRLDDAQAAIADAMRTGTRDRVILYHAAEINRASGRLDAARRQVAASLDGAPRFDLVSAPAAAALRVALGPTRVAGR